ncbi:hypothetical protein AVEN_26912-1 [Araneus ventricosus]|uniref:Uncharacterized protein n=1 Tax=Araneus ventricosus TaxID=182803 RepID=A0A4Y2V8F3_ARAVE|nr:hypothetical protein AVEN_16406-1 [Araneus ventricosus]GBO21560.1 hypothetical protein AVEN_26912-1 [Araneus ventricosus]
MLFQTQGVLTRQDLPKLAKVEFFGDSIALALRTGVLLRGIGPIDQKPALRVPQIGNSWSRVRGEFVRFHALARVHNSTPPRKVTEHVVYTERARENQKMLFRL